MFCYLILLFSISVSGASVLNRIEQTRKDSPTRLSQINLATRDITDADEQQNGQEVLSRGIRDLLYWNRVLNSLKGKLKISTNFWNEIFDVIRFSNVEGFEKKLKLDQIFKKLFIGSEGVNGEPSICQYFAHYYRKNALHSNHEDQMARKCRNTLRRVKKSLSARRA